ncbi:MAG: PAS domain S-box protein [Salinivirgaceae bacterium]|nr:PAS domain S-box protein [Salinivirgaceae bacterium]
MIAKDVDTMMFTCLCAALIMLAVMAFLLLRKRREQRLLRNRNNHLQQMLNAINESNILLIFNKDEKITSVSAAFYQLYGYTLESYIEKIGATLTDYLKWSGGQQYSRTGGISFIGKSKGRMGKSVWKQVNISQNFDSTGDSYYMVSELDITNVKEAEMELQREKKRSDELLLNMLPSDIVAELKKSGAAKPRVYNSASVLFADIKDFTQWSEKLDPKALIDTLQDLFSAFDDVLAQNYIEKIKTIGDAYMCAGGVPMKNNSHPFDIVLAAFGLQNAVKLLDERRARAGGDPWLMRIGIHTGPVVTGVVGKTRTNYDVWGDSVNTASRLESACEPGKINISKTTYDVIKDYFECEYRGKIPAKHKGEIDMYFVNRLKPEYSSDELGFIPNAAFRQMLAGL